MRKYGRTDGNQQRVVQELRKLGYSVALLGDVGGGCPDLLVGRGGINLFIELKDPDAKDKRQHELTPAEKQFHASWRGQIAKCETTEEILALFPDQV